MMLGPRDAFDNAADFAEHDVIGHADRLAGVNLLIDCGLSDPFYGYVTHLEAALPEPPSGGYSPGDVSIYAGIPTHWTIESSTASTCAASLVIPALGIQARLHVGSNTIELPALPAGTVRYSCAMGMYGGSIRVVNRPATPAGASTTGG